MPLHVLAGPGCDGVFKDEYLEDELEDDDVVISVGKIFKAITGSDGIPSEKPAALRMALGLRAVAIRSAREKELNGWMLTSNGNRADLDRLVREGGADGVTVLKMTEAQACARVAALVQGAERATACEGTGVAALVCTLSAVPNRPRGRAMTDEIRCKVSCEEDRTRSGPGRIVGRILTYGERATDRAELFERGALTWPADGVVLNRQHRGAPIMRVLPTQVGRRAAHRPNSPGYRRGPGRCYGNPQRALMRGLSSVVSGGAYRSFVGGVRRISQASMTAVGLVDDPSYTRAGRGRARVREGGTDAHGND